MTSKPAPGPCPPTPYKLEEFNRVAGLILSLRDDMVENGVLFHFRYRPYVEAFGSDTVPTGWSDKVLRKLFHPSYNEQNETLPQSPKYSYNVIPLRMWQGRLMLPDQPTGATPGYFVDFQQKFSYTKQQELQTVRLWLFLTLVTHFSNGRFSAILDPAEQKFHAVTCSRYINTFLDEREGTPDRRDYELVYCDGARIASAESNCTLCAPQFLLQVLIAHAKSTRKGDTYNAVWQCLMEEREFNMLKSLKLEGPSVGVFSTRMFERFICRVPEKIATAILTVAPGDYETADEYLDQVVLELRKAHYFNGQSCTGAVNTVRTNFEKFSQAPLSHVATSYAFSSLTEYKYVCGYCKAGLFTQENDCQRCKKRHDEDKQSRFANEARVAHAIAVVPMEPGPVATVSRPRRRVKAEKPGAVVVHANPPPSKRQPTDLYGNVAFLESRVSEAMQRSKDSEDEDERAYYNWHANRRNEYDREFSCFPKRIDSATSWFGSRFSTPGVTWIQRGEFFHYVAPVLAQLAQKKYPDDFNAMVPFPEAHRFPLVAICMLEEVNPVYWQFFSKYAKMHQMFERYLVPKMAEYFIQFTMVCRAVAIITSELELKQQPAMFFVHLREQFRLFLHDLPSFYPNWTVTRHNKQWHDLLALMAEGNFGKTFPEFMKQVTSHRASILARLQVYDKKELKSMKQLMGQHQDVNDGSARSHFLRECMTWQPSPMPSVANSDDETIDVGGNETVQVEGEGDEAESDNQSEAEDEGEEAQNGPGPQDNDANDDSQDDDQDDAYITGLGLDQLFTAHQTLDHLDSEVDHLDGKTDHFDLNDSLQLATGKANFPSAQPSGPLFPAASAKKNVAPPASGGPGAPFLAPPSSPTTAAQQPATKKQALPVFLGADASHDPVSPPSASSRPLAAFNPSPGGFPTPTSVASDASVASTFGMLQMPSEGAPTSSMVAPPSIQAPIQASPKRRVSPSTVHAASAPKKVKPSAKTSSVTVTPPAKGARTKNIGPTAYQARQLQAIAATFKSTTPAAAAAKTTPAKVNVPAETPSPTTLQPSDSDEPSGSEKEEESPDSPGKPPAKQNNMRPRRGK